MTEKGSVPQASWPTQAWMDAVVDLMERSEMRMRVALAIWDVFAAIVDRLPPKTLGLMAVVRHAENAFVRYGMGIR